MEDLLIFFRWFFPAMWQFFKIPFPLLGMTVGQVLIAASCVVFSFSLLGMLLRVSIFGRQLSAPMQLSSKVNKE